MNRERMDEALRATLEDHRLSRGEKKALGDLVAEDLHREARAIWRGRAFELAKAALATADAPGERRAILGAGQLEGDDKLFNTSLESNDRHLGISTTAL